MPSLAPISPAGTAKLSVTATTGRVARAKATTNQMRLATLPTDKTCYVALGGSTVVATTSGIPVLPGIPFTITVPTDGSVSYVAAICAATETATLYITDGEGQ